MWRHILRAQFRNVPFKWDKQVCFIPRECRVEVLINFEGNEGAGGCFCVKNVGMCSFLVVFVSFYVRLVTTVAIVIKCVYRGSKRDWFLRFDKKKTQTNAQLQCHCSHLGSISSMSHGICEMYDCYWSWKFVHGSVKCVYCFPAVTLSEQASIIDRKVIFILWLWVVSKNTLWLILTLIDFSCFKKELWMVKISHRNPETDSNNAKQTGFLLKKNKKNSKSKVFILLGMSFENK